MSWGSILWKREKWIWAAWMKNSDTSFIASLPKELVKVIIQFVRDDPLPEEQKQIMKELERTLNDEVLVEGSTKYVISITWYRKWKKYVNYDDTNSPIKYVTLPHGTEEQKGFIPHEKPGPIDNTDIIETETGEPHIRKTTLDPFDYVFLSEERWKLIYHWYGGGPVLRRNVVAGWNKSFLQVEVRPLRLKVFKSSDMQHGVWATFSKIDTVGKFKTTMCEIFGLKEEDVKVWDYYNSRKYKVLEDLSKKLDVEQILSRQEMLLEERDTNGNFAPVPKRAPYPRAIFNTTT